jgi:hypothetical protein
VSQVPKLGPVLLIALCLWAWYRHTKKVFEAQVTTTKNTFLSNQASFQSMTGEWRTLHPDLNECGTPDPEPGLVQFALIEAKPDGRFRIARGMGDQTFPGLAEASSALKADPALLQKLTQQMKSLAITIVLQHQSQLEFLSETQAPIGVMFVPSECPASKNFRAVADTKPSGATGEVYPTFAVLRTLTKNWYFFEEMR